MSINFFVRLPWEPMSLKDTQSMLIQTKVQRFKNRYNVDVSDVVIELAITSVANKGTKVLPDAAIDLLETLCSRAQLKFETNIEEKDVEKYLRVSKRKESSLSYYS